MSVSFRKLALIGIGLIGSSIALAARRQGLVEVISIATRKQQTLDEARDLNLGDIYTLDPAEAVRGADLVIICTPVGAYDSVVKAIAPALEPGAIVSDVGSVKGHVVKTLAPHLPPPSAQSKPPIRRPPPTRRARSCDPSGVLRFIAPEKSLSSGD